MYLWVAEVVYSSALKKAWKPSVRAAQIVSLSSAGVEAECVIVVCSCCNKLAVRGSLSLAWLPWWRLIPLQR